MELSLLVILTLWTHALGEGNFYYCFRIHGLRLIKNLTPLQVSLVRTRVWALERKNEMLQSMMKTHL
jgi:hypothetical protein